MQKYPEQDRIRRFSIKEEIELYEDKEFLKYEVSRNIEKYEDIEEATEDVYALIKYLEEQDSRCYFYIILTDGNFYNSIRCHENEGYEDFLYKSRYEYIDTWGRNSKKLNSLSEQEIDEIWTPKKMEVLLNGQIISWGEEDTLKATYDTTKKEYKFYIENLLKRIEGLEITKVDKRTRSIEEFEYQGKKYKIALEGNGKDKISYHCTIQEIEQCFDTEISYDKEQEKIYIKM